MNELKIGNLLAKVPIVQGGMGVGISLSGLASAVANAGGVGVISSAGLGLIYNHLSKNLSEASILGLKEELRKAREKTRGIVGVNIMVALFNAFKGRMENGYAFAGSNAWRCDKIMKVSELFAELKAEYEVKAASI